MAADDGDAAPAVARPRQERRSTTDRRYNRRTPASETAPPYFEVFQRMATALEGIERALRDDVAPADPLEQPSDEA